MPHVDPRMDKHALAFVFIHIWSHTARLGEDFHTKIAIDAFLSPVKGPYIDVIGKRMAMYSQMHQRFDSITENTTDLLAAVHNEGRISHMCAWND